MIAADSAESGPGAPAAARRSAPISRSDISVEHRRDQIGLGREVAIDRAGGDAGARGDRRDLHRRHAAFARYLPRGGDDGVMARGQPAGDILRAAIGHDMAGQESAVL